VFISSARFFARFWHYTWKLAPEKRARLLATCLEEIWQTLQVQLAASSPYGIRWQAEQSGHYIQRDEPELVVAAIKRVVELARTRLPKQSSSGQ